MPHINDMIHMCKLHLKSNIENLICTLREVESSKGKFVLYSAARRRGTMLGDAWNFLQGQKKRRVIG